MATAMPAINTIFLFRNMFTLVLRPSDTKSILEVAHYKNLVIEVIKTWTEVFLSNAQLYKSHVLGECVLIQ